VGRVGGGGFNGPRDFGLAILWGRLKGNGLGGGAGRARDGEKGK